MSRRLRIGTQGWNYDAWVGPFYPSGTRAADYLGVYGRAFQTVEVDSTFYAIPAARTVRGWADRTPPEFTFALKLPQEITHENRLRDSADAAALFFDRARELGPKLGPILMQLGPDFAYLRWMGPNRDIVDYSRIQVDRTREIEAWVAAIATFPAKVRDIYGYVNNHFAGHSPSSARELQRLLGQRPVEPDELGEQMSLF